MILTRIQRSVRRVREAWAVRRSGLWDARWYRANNPDVAASGERALRHYIRHGAAERRSPGPGFDSYGYWLLNPASDPHPLLHYLARPRAERRRIPPLEMVEPGHRVLESGWFDAEWYRRLRAGHLAPGTHPYVDYVHFGEKVYVPPSPVLDITPLLPLVPEDAAPCALAWLIDHGIIERERPPVVQGPDPGTAAVVVPRAGRSPTGTGSVLAAVHAYYDDLLPDVLSYVTHLPGDVTVAVVVPDADRVASTHRMIDEILGPQTRREVRVVDNRGRNFGPLVTDLVPLIRAHDYIVHLHTKKSVYSGRLQDGWREHMIRTLVGTRGLVDTVLGLFDDDPSIGVVYPAAYEGVPHWAHHWLGNTGVGRALYRRLGLDPALVSGIVDYPVGGMFWARTTALQPLWDAGFTLDDFPAEPVGADGTIAHALERCVVDVARSEGFDVVEVDLAIPQWRRNWSARRTLPTRAELERDLPEELERAGLVTVDLFDTLVLRPSLNPGTLQRLAAARVAPQFGIEAETVLRWRLDAEDAARRQVAGDVQVDDICAAAEPAQRDAVRALIDAEVDVEADVCIPRPWLIEMLRAHHRPGRPMVLMSDTYLPRSCIDDLVHRIGAQDLFDAVVVSNEVRARKDSGAMWDLVEQRFGVPRDRWLHLGDNEHSDVQIPRDRGIDARHVPSPHGAADYHGLDRRRVASSHSVGTDLVLGLAATGLHGDGQSWWDGASPARRFGWAGIGPLLWAYVTWLIQHPATSAAQRLLFVARDGHLPRTVLERLRPFVPDHVPPSEYVLTSRRSALTIAQAHGARLDLLLEGNTWVGTVRDVVRHRLGIALPDDQRLDMHITLPADLERAAELLSPYADLFVDQGRRDLRVLEQYLRHLGVRPEDSIVLADLGYSATIQRCLETVLPHAFTGLYATTTPRASTVRGAVHGLFGEGVDWPAQDSVTMENGLLLEVVWAADHGQVECVRSTSQGLEAHVRLPDARTDAEFLELSEVRQGAIDFCVEVIERFGPELLDAPVDAAASVVPFAYLMSGQVPWANDVLATIEVEGDFTGVGSSRVRRPGG